MSSHQKMSHSSVEHNCTLKEVDTTGLPKLPPNASCFTKFLRFIRILTLLNTSYKESKTFFRNKSAMIAERKRHARGYFFVLHPFSSLNFFFDCLFFVIWTYNMFTTYIKFFMPLHWFYALKVIARVNNFFQCLVICSFFIKGFIDVNRKICINPKIIIKKYVTTYFVFDLIILCLDNVISLFYDMNYIKSHHYPYYYLIASIVLISYFIRTPSLIAVLHGIITHFGFGDYVYFLFSRIIYTMFFLNAFTCLVASLPRLIYGNNLPKNIFLVRARLHDLSPGTNITLADLYTKTLLLVTCTFFGLNYGKVLISEVSDFIPLIIIRIFGRFFTLFTLADFLKYFGRAGIAESKYEQYLAQINEFMNTKNLPKDLRKRILTYYEYKMQRNFFDVARINETLSVPLRNELFLYGAKRWIDKTPHLRNIGSLALGSLFAHMTVETYLTDDVIFDCGVHLEHVYFVACGTIIVYNKNGLELGHFTDGEEVGVINMWTGRPTYYKTVAAETTEIYMIHKKYMLDFLTEQYQLTKFYEKREAERAKRFTTYEELLKGHGSDVISQLREQKILEKRTVRQVIFD